MFHELVSRGFQGPVYPINREADFVASVRAWRSVLDVPGELDLAIICVPADQVLRVAEECAYKRVQGLVVLSAGFADRDEAGEAAEIELVTYARRHGMPFCEQRAAKRIAEVKAGHALAHPALPER